ncbi:MAG: YbhB/YbcL family Raf kinase inhibitor-like protein [Chitinispirillales bacterium]|jgi:Raf kinase inhibitor-like YbhB/YbcL family protein|nr:YbhB/YbcL family Raf kinase inhibitor-like protein [Chitinispirillales bacterium]
MDITSPAFLKNGPIPPQYGCKGRNINPPLEISGIPPEAKSLVLIMHDPDAPKGDFVHWVCYDMELVENLEAGAASGRQGINSSGKLGYMGPCPPSGTHHYHFKIYALNTKLNLPSGASRQIVESAMIGHVVESSELVGTFSVN